MSTCRRGWSVGGALAIALLVAGCGGSGSKAQPTPTPAGRPSASTSTGTQTTTSASSAQTTTSKTQTAATAPPKHSRQDDIVLASPVVREGAAIPARYTCAGSNISPPLRWGSIPAGSVELALFMIDLEGESHGGGPLIVWAVAGLPPTLTGLATGALPAGALVGRNSGGKSGYSICPPPGGVHHYGVVLLALPHPIAAAPGFDANAIYPQALDIAESQGLFGFHYERG